jgi:RHS repeat-associated protein
VAFTYDSAHQRIKQVIGGGSPSTTYYLNAMGAQSEKFLAGSTTTWHDYIYAAGQLVAEHFNTGGTISVLYAVDDHLRSTSSVTNASASVTERDSYDAWGRRRNANGTDDPTCSLTSAVGRGYTGHEMMDAVCLVNANARIYDPTIGRFMSADSIVSDPFYGQSFNRYAYVNNNPLNANDPSGHQSKDDIRAAPPKPPQQDGYPDPTTNDCLCGGSRFAGGDPSTPIYNGDWLGFMNGGVLGSIGGGFFASGGGGAGLGGHFVWTGGSYSQGGIPETIVIWAANIWVPSTAPLGWASYGGQGYGYSEPGVRRGTNGGNGTGFWSGGLLPHGFGVIGGANIDAGAYMAGGSAQFAYGAGYFSKSSFQTFMSDGDVAYIGPFSAAYPSQSGSPTVVGLFAGAGGGVFVTNATDASQLAGSFHTLTINGGAGLSIPSAQLAYGHDATGDFIWEFSIQAGPGVGVSGSGYDTTTAVPWHW